MSLCQVYFLFVIYQQSVISLAWLEIRFFQKIGFLSMWQNSFIRVIGVPPLRFVVLSYPISVIRLA
jgi:hypothetical protein